MPEAQPERDEPRLGAVVQVALDPAELGVLLLDGSEPGGLERLDAAGEPAACRAPADEEVEHERDREAEHDPRRPEGATLGHCPDRQDEHDERRDDTAVDRHTSGEAVRPWKLLDHQLDDDVDREQQGEREQHPLRPEVPGTGGGPDDRRHQDEPGGGAAVDPERPAPVPAQLLGRGRRRARREQRAHLPRRQRPEPAGRPGRRRRARRAPAGTNRNARPSVSTCHEP